MINTEEILEELAGFFKLFSISDKKPSAVKNYVIIFREEEGLLFKKDFSLNSGYVKYPVIERHPLPPKLVELMKSDAFPERRKELSSPNLRSVTAKHGFKIISAEWRKLHEKNADPDKIVEWGLALEAMSDKYHKAIYVIAQIVFFGGVFAGIAALFWHIFS